MPAWTAQIVDQTGTLTSAWAGTITSISDVKDGHGSATLTAAYLDTGNSEWLKFVTGEYDVGNTSDLEVQLLRDGDVVLWFTPARLRFAGGKVEITVAGLTSLFQRRTIGSPTRTNQLVNGSFEDTLGVEWEAVNCTATRTTSRHFLEAASVELSAPSDPDAFITQTYESPANGVGVLWIATAMVYLPTFTDAALSNRGLYLERLDDADVVVDAQWDRIDERTPVGSWVRMRATLQVPPATDATIRCRTYCPSDGATWDDVRVVSMESASFSETDVVDVITYLVELAQGTAVGKDDLDITVDAPASTGVLVNRTWQYAEHVWTWDAIQELVAGFPDRNLGVRMLPGTRTFKIDYPRHSTTVDPIVLRYGAGNRYELLAWEPVEVDIANGVNQPIVQSDLGDGADREEFYAAATGRVFEQVYQGPLGAVIDTLPVTATNIQAERRRPLSFSVLVAPTVEVNLVERWLAGTFVMGDLVTLAIVDGDFTLDATYEVVAMTFDPATECPVLQLNAVS